MVKNEQQRDDLFVKILLISVISLLFTFYGFLLFDLFGIRELVQLILVLVVVVVGIISLVGRKKYKKPDYIARLFIFINIINLLSAIILRLNFSEISNIFIGLFFVLIFYQLNYLQKEFALKVIINIIFFFSVLGIIEFITLIIFPSLTAYTYIVIDDVYKGGKSVFTNWIVLLGLTDGSDISFLGLSISRMRSFLNEPSLSVAYFLLPAGLALTFKDSYKGVIILVFCLLTFSGSIYGTLAISVFAFIIYYMFKYKRLLILFPLLLFTCVLLLVFQNNLEQLMNIINYPGKLLGLDFLQKGEGSTGIDRFFVNFLAVMEIKSNLLLGVPKILIYPIGSIIGVYYSYGPIAFVLNIILFFTLMKNITDNLPSRLFDTNNIPLIIIYGALFSNFFFMWYGFNSSYGYTVLYLAAYRLNFLYNSNVK